ncbi:hypothetical protein BpHYR1_017721 [Brachionus plicatilis]|uniref:Uncharacterized protein n=1 Tax=Brachionus plicatilis TaxID=10195 RepID=A0A3M7T1J8_BRAPC|nr:hypothetical protein BpHYR1_017721 [Brachionus plicatilis]
MKQVLFNTFKVNDGWYEGLQLFTPSTNNSLEATKRISKNEDTLRDRLVLSRFVMPMDEFFPDNETDM